MVFGTLGEALELALPDDALQRPSTGAIAMGVLVMSWSVVAALFLVEIV